MKKYILLAIGSFFILHSQSQVTIPTSHMPRIGDEFTYAVHMNVYSPKPISGGVYDFSDLAFDDSTLMKYVANDNLAEFPNSNLKFIQEDVDNATIYLRQQGNDLFVIGFPSLQIPLPVQNLGSLAGTMKFLTLPLTSTTNITTTDQIRTVIPKDLFPEEINIDSIFATIVPGAKVDSFVVKLNISLNLKVDGQGKITTPFDNNLDVLKLVRKIDVSPKISFYGKAFNFPVNDFDVTSIIGSMLPTDQLGILTHTYYSPSFRQEILNATLDSNQNYSTVNYRYKTKDGTPSTSRIAKEGIDDFSIEVQQREVLISHNSNIHFTAEILSFDGKVIVQGHAQNGKLSLDKSSYSSPIILKITSDQNTWVMKYMTKN